MAFELIDEGVVIGATCYLTTPDGWCKPNLTYKDKPGEAYCHKPGGCCYRCEHIMFCNYVPCSTPHGEKVA